jgi:methyltransferase family protein
MNRPETSGAAGSARAADADALNSPINAPAFLASLIRRAHERRWHEFAERFPGIAEMRVLDLGGTAASWLEGEVRPTHVTLVNLPGEASRADREASRVPWIDVVAGDACDTAADWGRFDLVYSNSVIEHVGGHERRQRFADTVHRHADSHWVQTPYRYFPIEPHYRLPFIQHVPVSVAARMMRAWPYAAVGEAQRKDPVADVLSIELLSFAEMHHYFPGSEVIRESFLGLPKGLIAVSAA